MPANYVLLGEVTLAATTASVVFSNIPQTGYTDLKVVASVRSSKVDTTDYIYFTFSGSSSYAATKVLYGSGSAAGSFNWSTVSGITGGIINAANNTASTFSSVDIYIPNYTASQYKSVSIDTVQEGNTGSGIYATMMAGLSNNNAAVSTITFASEGGSFVAGSTFYLYGIAAVGTTPVIAPFASGGDIIQNDGTYWIHTFLSSGTFTPGKSLNCDYLVVAGGGGGGGGHGGGGGAGGYRTSIGGSTISAAAQAYPITVGAGGASGSVYATISDGASGSNSVFSTITSTAGGGGGGYNNNTGSLNNGKSGGSGGGGVGQRTSSGGTATSGQGNNGGSTTSDPGAGGGGANAVGGNGGGAPGAAAGNGGNGTANSITGTSVTYAGGGGGGNGTIGSAGTGGSGGGGAGSNAAQGVGTNGTANLGGGGGGGGGGSPSGSTPAGGNGGSGVVIIRYPIA